MSDLVTKGLIGGHLPTGGFYEASSVAAIFESILNPTEAFFNTTPEIRVRMDLDGDGIFEVIEQADVMSIGNLTRAVEYYTNKPIFGSATITIRNNDLRYSDNNVNALTYYDPAASLGDPTYKRYHMRKVLIELGFDGPNKEDSWQPLFTGFIAQKNENASERQVDISLIDEWTKLLAFNLGPTIQADEFFPYASPTIIDDRQLQLGTYYGAQRYLINESTSKTNQLLIPCAVNMAGHVTIPGAPLGADVGTYRCLIPTILNWDIYLASHTSTWPVLYFWDWGATPKHWVQISASDWDLVTGKFIFNTATPTGLSKSLTAYFTDPDADPVMGISTDQIESNPIKILFDILYNLMEIPFDDIDATNVNPDLWTITDLDFNDPNYHSFDQSAHALDMMTMKTCVRVNSKTGVNSLIDDLTSLTRGSFFIDKGKKALLEHPATRRIRFVIHQPRLISDTMRTLTDDHIHGPTLNRAIDKILNSVSVTNFDYDPAVDKFADTTVYNETDADSIAVYGEKSLSIDNKPGSIVFLYENGSYAAALAQHYLLMFKEPPMEMTFDSDLIGTMWDLKSLLRIQETSSLGLSQYKTDLKDIHEIYSIAFNSASFMISFTTLWAGYLLMPDGDPMKRWMFTDNFWTDHDEAGIEYCAY